MEPKARSGAQAPPAPKVPASSHIALVRTPPNVAIGPPVVWQRWPATLERARSRGRAPRALALVVAMFAEGWSELPRWLLISASALAFTLGAAGAVYLGLGH